MAATLIRGNQVVDGGIQRVDLDVATAGQAVIRKAIAGVGITLISTGVDAGTGDVTISAKSFGAPTLTNNAVATTETIVARWSIAANALASLDNLRVYIAGQVSSTATLTFRMRFGTAGTVADALLGTFTVSAAGVANAYHFLDALISILSATTATACGTSTLAGASVSNATAAFAAATVNLTVANFLSITLVQSVAQTYTSRAAKLSL